MLLVQRYIVQITRELLLLGLPETRTPPRLQLQCRMKSRKYTAFQSTSASTCRIWVPYTTRAQIELAESSTYSLAACWCTSVSRDPVQDYDWLQYYLWASTLTVVCFKKTLGLCFYVGKNPRAGNEELLTCWRPFEDSKPLQRMFFPATEGRNAVSHLASTHLDVLIRYPWPFLHGLCLIIWEQRSDLLIH